MIKPEHLGQPVFLKSTPQGLSSLEGEQISASSLSKSKFQAQRVGIIYYGNSSRREGLT